MKRKQPDHKDGHEQLSSKDKVVTAPTTLNIEDLEAVPGPPTKQIPKVCLKNTSQECRVSSFFQMTSSAQSNKRDISNESKIKIFKMIG